MADAPTLALKRHAIVITPGLWGRRYEVTIAPPTSSHSLRTFSGHREARAFAEEVQQAHGWPICDHTVPVGA